MYRAVHFTNLYSGKVIFDNYGGMKAKVYSENTMDVKGKVAYLALDTSTQEPWTILNGKDNSYHCWPKTDKVLYIAKESRVPRMILRNSDYKITINPNNADYVVIPANYEDDVPKREFNIAYIASKDKDVLLYYFTFDYSWSAKVQHDAASVEKIKKVILDKLNYGDDWNQEFYYFDQLPTTYVYFVKRCPEVESILTDNTFNYKVIIDTRLRIDSPIGINIDSLKIWGKMSMTSEREMVAKAIIGSSWKEYPCTIAAFIDHYNLDYYGGEQLAYVKKSIGYDYYRNHYKFRADREVQPNDWNLLQEWLMSLVGLDEKGGFISYQLSDSALLLTRHAKCFKPVYISEPMLFQEIEARLKN